MSAYRFANAIEKSFHKTIFYTFFRGESFSNLQSTYEELLLM